MISVLLSYLILVWYDYIILWLWWCDGWPYHCCHHTHTWYEGQELHSCFCYHRACYIWSREGNEETRRSNSSCERYVLASMLSTSSYSSIYLLIHLSIHPSIYSSICLLIHLSTHSSIYLFIHLSIHPSVYSSIYLLIHLASHPSIHPSIHHLFIHLSTLLSSYS